MRTRRFSLSTLLAGICLLTVGIGGGMSARSHALAALDGALANKAGEEAGVLADYFSRARSINLLTAAGFDPTTPALVSWLGVSFYLTRQAIAATLAAIGALAPATELIVEYALPPELRDARGQAYAEFARRVSEERGEPWLTFLTPRT